MFRQRNFPHLQIRLVVAIGVIAALAMAFTPTATAQAEAPDGDPTAETTPPPAPTPTTEPAVTPEPTATPAATPPPVPTPEATPTTEPTGTPDATPQPTATSEPTATPDLTPEPTATPDATATPAPTAAPEPSAAVAITEFHYDNTGTDVGEFIEVSGPAGTDLSGWSIVLYNGSNSATYDTVALSGVIDNEDGTQGAIDFQFPSNGIQNGPDALALVDPTGNVIEFLSYEGVLTATDGPANGLTSTDIGVAEVGTTPVGQSLQLIGGVWTGPAANSAGDLNTGIVGPTPTPTPSPTPTSTPGPMADVAITEFHYDNAGADVDEFIEVTGTEGTDLTGWTIVLYNGSNSGSYGTVALTGVIDNEDGVSGAVSVPVSGLQNGSPDGFALVAPDGTVVEFLSYEGTITASDGPAAGTTSLDVVVSELSSTPIGQSLQLISGVWTGPAQNSAGDLNPVPTPFLSELHYDNASSDVGEFVEVTGPAGFDLTDWSVVLYNGNGGTVYNTIALAGNIDDEGGSQGAVDFAGPSSGIQNGAPDGLALVDPLGNVVEFLSYEGTFVAVGGPADGMTSVDIGVAEGSATAVGESLQLLDGVWIGPAPASPGALNSAVVEPPEVVLIHDIQGNGTVSPLDGQIVIISGIVVGDFQTITTADPTDEPLDGFFVQEEDADADADPATSEGIFVYNPGGADVAVGDLVEVTGTISEFFELTEMSFVSDLTIVSSGNDLPTPATPTVPTAVGDPAVDWEAIEGMSVLFTQPLYATDTFPLGRYGEIGLSAIGAQNHPNQTNAVGSAEALAERQLNFDSRVVLDDGEDENESFSGTDTWNPDPTPYLGGPDNTLRSGDVVTDLRGVVHYSFEEFEIQPVNVADPNNPDGAVNITRTPRPAVVPAVGGSLQVASFNVLNYFTTLDDGSSTCGPPSNPQGCRGANTQAEFDLQSAKIATAIAGLNADIVGLIELENNGSDAAISDLVDKINALTTRTYTFVPTGFVGTDAITVGFIYDTTTVATEGDYAVLDSSVSPAFIDNKNRPVLAQTFIELETEATLTAAVGHLKSKGSSCDSVSNPGDPAYGVVGYSAGADVDDPNFQGNCNLTRVAAAQVLGQWVANNPTGAPSDNVLIIGDLNAYQNEDPITTLEAQGYTDLHAIDGTSWAASGHSYVFDGEHGTLDYLLANPSLLTQVTGAAAWHINADEPFAIDYQDFNPAGQAQPDAFKSSDHDPTIVGLDLTPPIPPGPQCDGQAATIVGTNGNNWLFGTSGDDVIVALGGNDLVFSFGGNDIICLGDGNDVAFASNGDDRVFGEGGRDTISGGNGADLVDGGTENDLLSGDRGDDTVVGGSGNDRLFGSNGDDVLDGGDGRDYGNGGRGNDGCSAIEFAFECEYVLAPLPQ